MIVIVSIDEGLETGGKTEWEEEERGCHLIAEPNLRDSRVIAWPSRRAVTCLLPYLALLFSRKNA